MLKVPVYVRKKDNKDMWVITSPLFPGYVGQAGFNQNLEVAIEEYFTQCLFNSQGRVLANPEVVTDFEKKGLRLRLFALSERLSYKWYLHEQIVKRYGAVDAVGCPSQFLAKPMGMTWLAAKGVLNPWKNTRVDTLKRALGILRFSMPCWHCINIWEEKCPTAKLPLPNIPTGKRQRTPYTASSSHRATSSHTC